MDVEKEPQKAQVEKMDIDENAVNRYTDLVSRMAGALGMATLNNLRALNCLIVGCRGTGIETAKNLVLTGPRSVVIWDREPTRLVDLGANFYLTMGDVNAGTPRGDAVQEDIQSLNPYCDVSSFTGSFDEVLSGLMTKTGEDAIAVVIVTELLPQEQLYKLNQLCRQSKRTFLMALTTGVTGTLFSDFGDAHEVTDIDGEATDTFAVAHLERVKKNPVFQVSGVEDGEEMVVVTIAGDAHGLDDGSLVQLDDFEGPLAKLNGVENLKAKRIFYKLPKNKELFAELEEKSMELILKKSSLDKVGKLLSIKAEMNKADDGKSKREKQMFNRFMIDLSDSGLDLSEEDVASWVNGGLVNQRKAKHTLEFKSLEETLVCPPGRYSGLPLVTPQHMDQKLWEGGAAIDIHLCWAGALAFYEENKRWPRLGEKEDEDQFVKIVEGINNSRAENENACKAAVWSWEAFGPKLRDIDEKRVRRFARYFPTELTGMCAYLGGAIAQEVVKRFGKYKPIQQWVHYDDQNLITDESASNILPLMGTRYDWQTAVLGKDFQAKVADQKIFLVGCGALGCEYLKGLALMGVATGSKGQVWVTDMDRIEVSNLSRQFLFRQEMVGKPKSTCGAKVVQGWNPAFNIRAIEMFVGPKTETYFDDKFWENLDICWNALDNVEARKYTDSRCLFYSKPLLESGTLGTKCNSEIILPYRTKSYNDGVEDDSNEKAIAMCTLRNFPYLPLHCIEYAKQQNFEGFFEAETAGYEQFRSNLEGYLKTLAKEPSSSQRLRNLKRVKRLVDCQAGGLNFIDCIGLSFEQMVKDYRNNILDLKFSNPRDKKKEDGSEFWSGTKRFPTELDFSYTDELAMNYLYCSSNLYAFVFGLDYVRDKAEFAKICQSMGLKNTNYDPKFVETKEEEDEDEEDKVGEGEEEQLEAMLKWANGCDRNSLAKGTPHEFEKDDDTNFHIGYLTVATNMRARNYKINESTRMTVKLTAGRIIPALATTTAMVCGLCELEFCKLVLGLPSAGIEKFRQANINLGSATFNVFEPEPAIQYEKGVPKNFTSWDKIVVDNGDLTCGEFLKSLEMLYPGLEIMFVQKPGVDPEKGINPVLINVFQAQVGQAAIEENNDYPEALFRRKPNLRMAKRMLDMGRKNAVFERQMAGGLKYVQQGKEMAGKNLFKMYCEQFGEPIKDREGNTRNYLLLEIPKETATFEGEDVSVPMIKYVYRH